MIPTPLSLLERIRQARNSSDHAWDRLFQIYGPLLRQWLRQYGVDDADAEDLFQEIAATLCRELPDFDHSGRPGAFRLWIRTILLNRLRPYWRLRKQTRGQQIPLELEQLADPESSLSQRWDREHDAFLVRRLTQCIEPEFSPDTWNAFRLQVLEGHPAASAAQSLGTTVNAVLLAKSRVLRRLRKEAEGLIDL